ncbi:MAG: ribonuclease HII [Bacteriovoracaceae bacterium]|nr:ribonuclease HII [Bacteriovoracaceae bacterium]
MYLDCKYIKGKNHLLGVDEVGRGPLAGPVVACTVIIFSEHIKDQLNLLKKLGVTDSKKLSSLKRKKILEYLKIDISKLETGKIFLAREMSFALSEISNPIIDKINILQASLLCMRKSSQVLFHKYKKEIKKDGAALLVDGKFAPCLEIPYVKEYPIIKGDSKMRSIALASIIAKEYRDQYMQKMHKKYPAYGFDRHMGYATAFHRQQVKEWGMSPIHRRTFCRNILAELSDE